MWRSATPLKQSTDARSARPVSPSTPLRRGTYPSYPASTIFRSDACSRTFDSKRSVANHHSRTHGRAEPPDLHYDRQPWEEICRPILPFHRRYQIHPGPKVGDPQSLDDLLWRHTTSLLAKWQKIDAIRFFIIPRLRTPPASRSQRWRHTACAEKSSLSPEKDYLPPFFYASSRTGGLGIPSVIDQLHRS